MVDVVWTTDNAVSRRPTWLLTGPAYLLFFSMLFVPTVYQEMKGVLLVIVLLGLFSAVILRQHEIRLHLSIILWTLFIAAVGMAFSFYGTVLNTPGAIRQLSVFVLWPLVYCFLLGAVTDFKNIVSLVKIMVYALIAISFYSAMYILNAVGVWPDFLYFELDQGQAIGIYEGFMEFNLYSISSLIFLVPFSIAAFLSTRSKAFPVGRLWLMFAMMMGIGVSILSGRRALWLALIVAPLITWFFIMLSGFWNHKRKSSVAESFLMAAVVAIALGSGGYLLGTLSVSLEMSAIFSELLRGFDFSGTSGGGDSAISRVQQFTALVEGWLRSPFFGNGLGASASLIRSDEQPWAYELVYVALLFQTGLIGCAIYIGAIAWIYWRGIKLLKENGPIAAIMLPTLVGMTCFLIANATNPYLAKFDYMWVIFWPLALINFHLLQKAGPNTRYGRGELASRGSIPSSS